MYITHQRQEQWTTTHVRAFGWVVVSRPYQRSCYWYDSHSLSVTWSILAKRCILAQVTIEVVYNKSIGTKMNDLDLLEVVQGHVNHCGVNISKNTWARDLKFGTRLCMGIPSGRTNNFPWKWAWPRLRDPYNFWHMIEHIFKPTSATDFKFGTWLCMVKAEWVHNLP